MEGCCILMVSCKVTTMEVIKSELSVVGVKKDCCRQVAVMLEDCCTLMVSCKVNMMEVITRPDLSVVEDLAREEMQAKTLDQMDMVWT